MELERPEGAEKDQVTELLVRFRGGDREAEAQLIPVVYAELRRLASPGLNRERRDHTLEPTALVHEAFLRMTHEKQPLWQNRAHFFGVSARLMPANPRRLCSKPPPFRKRGGTQRETLASDAALAFSPEKSTEVVMLDEALDRCIGTG